MKTPRIAHAVGHIDDDLVAAAAGRGNRRSSWLKWGSVAACFAVLVIAGAIILPSLLRGSGAADGKYKYRVYGSEADIEWPWEYKTNGEKYRTIDFNGREYGIRSLDPVGAEALGDVLGSCRVEGADSYTDIIYTETFEIRRINGVSEEKLVAAGNEHGFYVYMCDDAAKPETLGEVMDLYGLAQNLRLDYFVVCEGHDEQGSFRLDDDGSIWQILSERRGARLCEEDAFDAGSRNYLSFTATSDALGIYKRVVYISEDGYFATNIFDYSYIYFIGEEAAAEIIGYAKSNSAEAEPEPYELQVSGILTQICDGYVLVDDTALCADEEDGTVYKIIIDDIRARRGIECGGIKVGDPVIVKYDGAVRADNEVSGAYSVYKGTLVDGGLAVQE